VGDAQTRTDAVVHVDRDEGPVRLRNRRITYVVAVVVFTCVVGSAVIDSFTEIDVWGGESTDVAVASGGGVELRVRYATVSRPALATPFDIFVRDEDGFDGPIHIAVAPAYVEMWDFQAWYPDPSESTATPDQIVYTFEPPDGTELRVFLDARIQPAEQSGRDGWVAVLDGDGARLARVDFSTRVLP
jgi:hypothetical protein